MTTGYDQNGNRGNAAHGFQAQAEQVSRRLGESAQTVWLAGLGALGRVQSEGSKLFDSLVREGAAYERSGQRKAAASADELREEVETQFGRRATPPCVAGTGWARRSTNASRAYCAPSTSPSRTSWKTCAARWSRSRHRCARTRLRPSGPTAPPTRPHRRPAATLRLAPQRRAVVPQLRTLRPLTANKPCITGLLQSSMVF